MGGGMSSLLIVNLGASRGIRLGVGDGRQYSRCFDRHGAAHGALTAAPHGAIIDHFEDLQPVFARLETHAAALPLDIVRIRPPLRQPGKLSNCIANYWEHA